MGLIKSCLLAVLLPHIDSREPPSSPNGLEVEKRWLVMEKRVNRSSSSRNGSLNQSLGQKKFLSAGETNNFRSVVIATCKRH